MQNHMKNRKLKPQNHTKKEKVYIPTKQYGIIITLLILAVLVLIVRVAYLQFFEHQHLINEVDKRSINEMKRPVFRAMIKDREGKALAVSIEMYNIWANPKLIQKEDYFGSDVANWRKLAQLLDLDFNELQQKIEQNTISFVYLKKEITPEIKQKIKTLKLKGIGFDQTAKRYYPHGEALAQVIGITKVDNYSDGTGIEGVERLYDDLLTGESGSMINRTSRKGKITEQIVTNEGIKGSEIDLSIDARIQKIIYNNLLQAVKTNEAESATAVLIDIQTNEILAMVSAPSINPNNRTRFKPNLIRNRAVSDLFEPGSTVKPFIVALGLEQQVISPNTVLETLPITLNGYKVKDVSPQQKLSIEQILIKSSNVGVSKIALLMEPKQVVDFYHALGLGKSTDLGLNGEQKGRIAQDRKRWSAIERATYSYGYGLMVTPLQLARAYAVLGREGIYCPVTLLKVENDDEKPNCHRVLSRQVARQVLTYMHAVAENNPNVFVQGYQVGIKTGTAKKINDQGKYENRYIAYTAGIAPIQNPRFALVVIIDDPKGGQYYGGAISAPLFSSIIGSVLRAMNIPPDRPIPEHTLD